MFDTEKFILAVEAHPAIWDSKSSEFSTLSNKYEKVKAWEEVAQIMFHDWSELGGDEKDERGKELQKKWKNIKDNFLKEMKMQKCQQAGEPTKKKRRYVFFDKLLFLVSDPADQALMATAEQELRETRMFRLFDTEKFILAVEAHPAIWDPKSTDYSDREAKMTAWEEVAQEMFHDWPEITSKEKTERGREIQKKWKNIRDCMAKELRTLHKPKIGKFGKKKRKYMFFDHLLFLKPVLITRESADSLTSPNRMEEQESDSLNATSVGEEPEYTNAQESPYGASGGVQNRREIQAFEHQILRVLRDERDERSSILIDDYDKLFIHSLLPLFKQLSEDKKIIARIELTQVLQRLLQLPDSFQANAQRFAVFPGPSSVASHLSQLINPLYQNNADSQADVKPFQTQSNGLMAQMTDPLYLSNSESNIDVKPFQATTNVTSDNASERSGSALSHQSDDSDIYDLS